MIDLLKIKNKYIQDVDLRKVGGSRQVLICGGSSCQADDSRILYETLKVKEKEIKNFKVVRVGCMGLCSKGPAMIVYPEGVFYEKVSTNDLNTIITEHILNGRIVFSKVYNKDADENIVPLEKMPFFSKQMKVVLKNCGRIDPLNINEYISQDGYFALEKCLKSLTPDEVIDIISKSGLRGRGGAGFPTGKKWMFTKTAVGDTKYVCCNADEGDPGAFMDRAVLEGNPYAVIEAMTIAGYVIGANQGYIYVRAEYPLAVQTLTQAIATAKKVGLLGKNIMGLGLDFDIELRLGGGVFVCGEETALLESVEGRRGEPRPRPPYPANEGLYGKPTLLNNVETYANIPNIILNGAEWYNHIGTEGSKGTKIFSVGGKIANTGLVEVPMGITIKEIVEDICGGVPGGKLKAVQTGGPSGGCIPARYANLPVDYDSLTQIGAMMGSGGMIVLDDKTCMVDIAKYFIGFSVSESCGKCTPCRIGNKRLYEMLDKITKGKGSLEDLDKLKFLCYEVKQNSLCGLGQCSPNPILSTLAHFNDEYVEHVKNKRCPAGVCRALVSYEIDKSKCVGCSLCAKNCPTQAISGEVKKPFVIDQKKCIKCGECYKNCKFNAVKIGGDSK